MSFSWRRFFAILNTEHCFFRAVLPHHLKGGAQDALSSHPPQRRVWPRVCPRQVLCQPGAGALRAQNAEQAHPGGPDGHQKDRPRRAAQPRPPRHEGRHRRTPRLQHRRLRPRLRGPGHDPRLKSWQLSAIVAKLFAQAGLPDKAKQPGAKPPATLPPVRKPEA